MRILHTSDWHLGRPLYDRKRYDEFTLFLDWLAENIEKLEIDTLLVAGDIFDTSIPTNRAQELYYRFLFRVSKSCCKNIVVIAGNHDSPSFLDAPKELLRILNVYVIGATTGSHEDEVIVLKNIHNTPEAIICAVPYLRDKDIRTVSPGETIDDKNKKLTEGLQNHYANVCKIAEQQQKLIGNVPIIAMGHLFTAGGKTIDGDGVKELYVGSLAHINESAFPECINYFALGHLHVPQRVGESEHIRYSGSPIPMGYGESKQQKKVVLVEFNNCTPVIVEIDVPCFQPLEKISGSLEVILSRISELKQLKSKAWLEIEYKDTKLISNLREQIDEAIAGTAMEAHRVKDMQIISRVKESINKDETLDNLNVHDVFNRCLDSCQIPEEQREGLILTYKEIIISIDQQDANAE